MLNVRRIAFLHRWVLALFVFSLVVAVAAPLVHPQSLELVCSGTGMVKVIVHTDEGAQESGRMTMDCALCTATGAPPPKSGVLYVPRMLPLSVAVQSIPSAQIAAATRSPLPARGPPLLS